MTTDARRIMRQPAVDILARAMTEAQLMASVTDMADLLRLRWHHETDSRKSKAGFPDLVIVGARVLFVELKTQTGRVRPEQNEWLSALLRAQGVSACVWRPMDLLDGTVERTLRDLARRSR